MSDGDHEVMFEGERHPFKIQSAADVSEFQLFEGWGEGGGQSSLCNVAIIRR